MLAGFIRIVLPERLVYRHLGKDNWRSVLTAAVAGVPIPLCSCSVLPTAMSLRKSGASKGATTSFLISTPETGVDSIGITWALMDPLMTVVRPVAALVTALGSGPPGQHPGQDWGWAEEPPGGRRGEALASKAHDHGAMIMITRTMVTITTTTRARTSAATSRSAPCATPSDRSSTT